MKFSSSVLHFIIIYTVSAVSSIKIYPFGGSNDPPPSVPITIHFKHHLPALEIRKRITNKNVMYASFCAGNPKVHEQNLLRWWLLYKPEKITTSPIPKLSKTPICPRKAHFYENEVIREAHYEIGLLLQLNEKSFEMDKSEEKAEEKHSRRTNNNPYMVTNDPDVYIGRKLNDSPDRWFIKLYAYYQMDLAQLLKLDGLFYDKVFQVIDKNAPEHVKYQVKTVKIFHLTLSVESAKHYLSNRNTIMGNKNKILKKRCEIDDFSNYYFQEKFFCYVHYAVREKNNFANGHFLSNVLERKGRVVGVELVPFHYVLFNGHEDFTDYCFILPMWEYIYEFYWSRVETLPHKLAEKFNANIEIYSGHHYIPLTFAVTEVTPLISKSVQITKDDPNNKAPIFSLFWKIFTVNDGGKKKAILVVTVNDIFYKYDAKTPFVPSKDLFCHGNCEKDYGISGLNHKKVDYTYCCEAKEIYKLKYNELDHDAFLPNFEKEYVSMGKLNINVPSESTYNKGVHKVSKIFSKGLPNCGIKFIP